MTRLQQLEEQARTLTDSERACFATHLLCTLPAVLADVDEGIAEAQRRDRDLDVKPDEGLSWSALKKGLNR